MIAEHRRKRRADRLSRRTLGVHNAIPARSETSARQPDYAGRTLTTEQIAAGKHRVLIGGKWNLLGELQIDFLKQNGLTPGMTFLDAGCGSFRAGRHLIDYLDPGHYYGIDASRETMQAGYDVELTDTQQAKLPISSPMTAFG